MQEAKKYNGFYIGGLVAIILASLLSWTIFFLFLTLILYPIGIIFVLLSKKKWWIKVLTIVLPLAFTLPTAAVVSDFIERLMA
ncbi:hypothetical protein [Cyclobacterium qasimii]|uniref:Uncharacterized protein n=2 Tax=Cyclobacterium qasimii TaxID=1350429 RepID=S7V9Y3_9BACT|nr:hypothetical protein [Cyclobacterium qasimii]EPR67060.1 hypothetical protein ADICYQ_3930 [Cyclobacterium qasimii M12-11B]GEO19726.1 hypothetical protein CQA01_02600 [Cyclobacterium qasimii]